MSGWVTLPCIPCLILYRELSTVCVCAAAYRKTALEYHPDKAGAAVADEGKKKEIEEHFQKIQDAYETLSDPAKRREYDSTDDFDDTLPSTAHPTEFFKVSQHFTSSLHTLLSYQYIPSCIVLHNASGQACLCVQTDIISQHQVI